MKIAGVIITAILLCSALAGNPAKGADRIFLPDDVFYYRPASATLSPEAIWNNPASIKHDTTVGLQYMGEIRNKNWLKSWGFAMTGNGLGVAYRHLNNFLGKSYEEYTFAAGAEVVAGLNWGGSYRYIRSGPDYYNKRHFWNLAVAVRKSQALSLAAVFENLNRGKIDGRKSAIEERYALSYHFLKARVILSIEAAMASGQDLSDADFHYSAEYFSVKNWQLFGTVDNSKNYQIGLRYSHGAYSYGLQSHIAKADGRVSTILFIEYLPALAPARR